jgi:dTDP-4-amino-4,6-dideoxygalactose transaminase
VFPSDEKMMPSSYESKRDFAIHGGVPAFSEPLHVGHPNVGSREAFLHRVNEILDRRWLSNNGPVVREFEQRIADYVGVKHCIAMCNGTIAMEIAIRALDMKGEVIVPSWTFIATAHALSWQDITPVFADIDDVTHNLDPTAVRRMITPRTTGIIGVHVWGRAAPIIELEAIAEEHGLRLMFDAAHAFGCSYEGTRIGAFGQCEILSFHATKAFNSMEGGAIVTNDDELAEKARLMRNFGFAGYDNVVHPGTNGKMTEICAAMGLTNLDSIDDFFDQNRRNYETYLKELSGLEGLSFVHHATDEESNYHYNVVEVGPSFGISRDRLIEVLHAENILARKYFWPGCHGMRPYKELYPHASLLLPNTETVGSRVVVLPTGSNITPGHASKVCEVVRSAARLRP